MTYPGAKLFASFIGQVWCRLVKIRIDFQKGASNCTSDSVAKTAERRVHCNEGGMIRKILKNKADSNGKDDRSTRAVKQMSKDKKQVVGSVIIFWLIVVALQADPVPAQVAARRDALSLLGTADEVGQTVEDGSTADDEKSKGDIPQLGCAFLSGKVRERQHGKQGATVECCADVSRGACGVSESFLQSWDSRNLVGFKNKIKAHS